MAKYTEDKKEIGENIVVVRIYARKIDAIHAYAEILHKQAVADLTACDTDWEDSYYKNALIHEAKLYFDSNKETPSDNGEDLILTFQ